ncbi:hypothetical protein HG536_0H02860 [Torulaspora globosa]|uniref:Uncharacterized protein n=1 Tax=Torulaspora globosa TaxID=48254 RepID=A0A7G3ZN25_9SACH|nr:uncharacterized protein HG536_0H02860 [Torulaspora globosa]QLL34911.1 hypothetical protein HG536_0H02860 [Torulaspora globosa]
MENVITQVSQNNGAASNFLLKEQQHGQGYTDNGDEDNANSLIHLNIQENHYYITRDQLMSLPESLLLCLFPSGVFLDRQGQVISNLMPNDEVYVSNFPPDCFEYIMEVYSKAYEDLINFPVHKLNDRASARKDGGLSSAARGFFSFGGSASPGSGSSTENEILHEKPTIIVLREDLDYYCVPQSDFEFDSDESSDDLLYHVMAQVKAAAGSYLTAKASIFQGLYSSNRLKKQKDGKNNSNSKERTLGPAEQHLLDMLCSSGFAKDSRWENRTQEPGKTVISSLSLCRIVNETTEEFRQKYHAARAKWEQEVKAAQENTITPVGSSVSLNSLSRTTSRNNQAINALLPTKSASQTSIASHGRPVVEKRKSRLSTLADNVRSRSSSAQRSSSKTRHPEPPRLYDLVPRPDINPKLLLFWRKPARKCWWGEEKINLEVQVYGSWATNKDNPDKKVRTLSLKTPKDPEDGLNKISIPVRLHIRRVWTLELSAVGVE